MSRMLREVVEQAGLDQFTVNGDDSVDITSVDFDSRRVAPGSLFCCLRGRDPMAMSSPTSPVRPVQAHCWSITASKSTYLRSWYPTRAWRWAVSRRRSSGILVGR